KQIARLLVVISVQQSMNVFFFFSSRRRHTRSKRDWSSDVCSSDLWKFCNRFGCYSNCDYKRNIAHYSQSLSSSFWVFGWLYNRDFAYKRENQRIIIWYFNDDRPLFN